MFREATAKFTAAGIFSLSIITGMVPLLLSGQASAQPATGRNILFIAVDDMRNWVGYGGDYAGTVHTPNIDALAAQSTRFLNAYTAIPACTASRTTVMTGLSPETHGIKGFSFGPTDPLYDALFSNPAIQSIPELMSANGYYSAASGKVFHSPFPDKWDEQGPLTDFVAVLEGYFPGPDGTNFNPTVLPANEIHPDQVIADWAGDFITDYTDSAPFFLAMDLYQPHVPWKIPQWAYDLYPINDVVAHVPTPNDLSDVPAQGVLLANAPYIPTSNLSQYDAIIAAGKAQAYTQAYLAALSHTDAMIGEVLDALAASAHANNTDVILWSDHGFHLGEKFHWKKMTLWDQSLRVPLLVKSPGNPNYPVGDNKRNVSTLDLAPTVADLAGLATVPQFDGKPLYVDDGVNKVFAYWGKSRATMVGGFKVIDYDTTVPADIDDFSAYWTAFDKGEKNNIFLPLLIAILKAQAQANNGN
ncbi:MAG: arylsulfatase A-like enzyme [Halioglobus sp.]|jgi:arylsulfatase A-like enzyme